MPHRSRTERRQVRGQHTNTHFDEGLADVVRETTRLWRKYHLGYDQTKYVVAQARRGLRLRPPGTRRRTINRLDKSEVERLIQHTYQSHRTKRPTGGLWEPQSCPQGPACCAVEAYVPRLITSPSS